MKQETQEFLVNTAKNSPAAVVVATTLFGLTWSDVAYIATALYTSCLFLGWVWDRGQRVYRYFKRNENDRAGNPQAPARGADESSPRED